MFSKYPNRNQRVRWIFVLIQRFLQVAVFLSLVSLSSCFISSSSIDESLRSDRYPTHFRATAISKTSDLAIAVGFEGLIVRSTDKGKTWQSCESNTHNRLYDVYLLDDNQIWAVGYGGAALLSKNQGKTWDQLDTGATVRLTGVHFSDSKHGVIVGDDSYIAYSNDGGKSWNQVLFERYGKGFRDVISLNAGTFIATGYEGLLYRSTDFGVTWEQRTLPDGFSAYAIDSPSSSFTVIAGSMGMIFASTDQGLNWVPQKSPTTNYIRDICFINEQIGWIAGYERVFKTTDAGNSWKKLAIDCSSKFQSISFSYDKWGILAGTWGSLLRSDDWGESFSLVGSGSSHHLNDIAVSATHSVCIGDEGTILVSKTGGTWLYQTPQTLDNLHAVSMPNDSCSWIVGNSGVILRSTDGATSWHKIKPPQPMNFFDVLATSETEAYICGDGGFVAQTQDGGATWKYKNTPKAERINALVSKKGYLMALGESNNCYLNATGDYWVGQDLSLTNRTNALDCQNSGICAIGCDDSYFLISNNFGENSCWQLFKSPAPINFRAVYAGERYLWFAGSAGKIIRFDPNRESFREYTLKEPHAINAITAFNDDLYTAGEWGSIHRIRLSH